MIINRFFKGSHLSSYDETNLPSASFLFLGHKTDNNGLVAKDNNKKEIRRDSKTGLEKFEDYFDSDSDNTTLQGKYLRIILPNKKAEKNFKRCFSNQYHKNVSIL